MKLDSNLGFGDLWVLVAHRVGETEGEGDLPDFVAAAVIFLLPGWLDDVWKTNSRIRLNQTQNCISNSDV